MLRCEEGADFSQKLNLPLQLRVLSPQHLILGPFHRRRIAGPDAGVLLLPEPVPVPQSALVDADLLCDLHNRTTRADHQLNSLSPELRYEITTIRRETDRPSPCLKSPYGRRFDRDVVLGQPKVVGHVSIDFLQDRVTRGGGCTFREDRKKVDILREAVHDPEHPTQARAALEDNFTLPDVPFGSLISRSVAADRSTSVTQKSFST